MFDGNGDEDDIVDLNDWEDDDKNQEVGPEFLPELEFRVEDRVLVEPVARKYCKKMKLHFDRYRVSVRNVDLLDTKEVFANISMILEHILQVILAPVHPDSLVRIRLESDMLKN